MEYTGLNGFLETRASLMLDVVFLAMFAVLPITGWSIWLVKYRGRVELHKRIQTTLGIVLLVSVTLFELDMRLFTDWRHRAKPSPYFTTLVFPSLYIHLCFAIPTTVLWAFVIVRAHRNFASLLVPSFHRLQHIYWARLAAFGMLGTAITGWAFYFLAFVA